MAIRSPFSLTECRRFFEAPALPRQRQYEALRAFFVEEIASAEAARRFGYAPGAFRVLCHAFRRGELPEFFATARTGPRQQPKKSRAHEQIVALRKRNYSIYEISQALKEQGMPLGAAAVREVLAQVGFAPGALRRCRAGTTRSGRSGCGPRPRRPPMSMTLPWRPARSPPGSAACSCSCTIWCVLISSDALALGAKLPGSAA